MRSSPKILLFVVLGSAIDIAGSQLTPEALALRAADVSYDWKCMVLDSYTGNYPSDHPFDEMTFLNAANWTTVRAIDKNRLAHKFKKNETWAGFSIKPEKSGKDHRLIIHLARTLEEPFDNSVLLDRPYEVLNKSSIPTVRDVLGSSPFNCHVSREIHFKADLIRRQLRKCTKNVAPKECPEMEETSRGFQCVAGSKSPVCCYFAHLQASENRAKELETLAVVYGQNVSTIFDECSSVRPERDIKADCPAPKDEDHNQFYFLNKNVSCNPLLAHTQDSCLFIRDEVVQTRPCLGKCLTGLVVNVEITPGDEGSEPETVITLLQRGVDFNQRSLRYSKEGLTANADANSFGYDHQKQGGKRKHQVQILTKKVKALPIYAGKFNKFWIHWDLRPPTCVASKSSELMTPVLVAGMEGSVKPVFELDFACTQFVGDESNSWRHGWFGSDILLPRISTVWMPNYYAVNSLRNSKFTYTHGGSKDQCFIQRRPGRMPTVLIIGVVVMGIFFFTICLLCIAAERLRKAEKEARWREKKK